jgi:muramoyltetrapeptide carboxypeptidase
LRIALFAPSSPPVANWEEGLAILRQEGPRSVIIEQASPDQSGDASPLPYLAGEDSRQADRFVGLICSPDLDIVWATRGGYGSLRWANMVPWETIQPGRPPVMIGFSDISFLHAALSFHGYLSIHGPTISSLSETDPAARQDLWACLEHGIFPELCGRTICPGTAEGRLAGGNLTCVAHMVATAYEPTWNDALLFLEDHNEALYRLDRMLTQLLLAGRLSRVAGIAVGQLLGTKSSRREIDTLLRDRLSGLGVPVVADLPVGHGARNHPLLIGGNYILDGESGTLQPRTRLSPLGHSPPVMHSGGAAKGRQASLRLR